LTDCMGYDKLLLREQNAIYLAACHEETRFACLSALAPRIFSRNVLIICNQFFLFKIKIKMHRS